MAPVSPLIGALARIQARELGTFRAALGNPFILLCLLLLGTQPASATFLVTLVGLVVFVPLAANPARRIPPERLALLPLSPFDHLRFRLGALAASPILWAVLGLLLWGGGRHRWLALWMAAAALLLNLLQPLFRRMSGPSLVRRLPSILPGGSPLLLLVRKNLRELLQVLDPYLALLLSLAGLAYRRMEPAPQADALLGITLLVVLALGSCAQQLFALEGRSGQERTRLWPLTGWRILLAKDLAFLLLLAALVLPLAPLPGLAGGLAALAAGHHPSIRRRVPQVRWRFVAAPAPGTAFLQILGLAAVVILSGSHPIWVLGLSGLGWGLSLVLSGRRLE